MPPAKNQLLRTLLRILLSSRTRCKAFCMRALLRSMYNYLLTTFLTSVLSDGPPPQLIATSAVAKSDRHPSAEWTMHPLRSNLGVSRWCGVAAGQKSGRGACAKKSISPKHDLQTHPVLSPPLKVPFSPFSSQSCGSCCP